MDKKYRQAADAAAVVTAIETDDYSENTAQKFSLFASVFVRELEAVEKPSVKKIKNMGDEIDQVGKRPSILSRGGIICLNERAFYEYTAATLTKFAYEEDYKSVQAAQEFVEYMKREFFGEASL